MEEQPPHLRPFPSLPTSSELLHPALSLGRSSRARQDHGRRLPRAVLHSSPQRERTLLSPQSPAGPSLGSHGTPEAWTWHCPKPGLQLRQVRRAWDAFRRAQGLGLASAEGGLGSGSCLGNSSSPLLAAHHTSAFPSVKAGGQSRQEPGAGPRSPARHSPCASRSAGRHQFPLLSPTSFPFGAAAAGLARSCTARRDTGGTAAGARWPAESPRPQDHGPHAARSPPAQGEVLFPAGSDAGPRAVRTEVRVRRRQSGEGISSPLRQPAALPGPPAQRDRPPPTSPSHGGQEQGAGSSSCSAEHGRRELSLLPPPRRPHWGPGVAFISGRDQLRTKGWTLSWLLPPMPLSRGGQGRGMEGERRASPGKTPSSPGSPALGCHLRQGDGQHPSAGGKARPGPKAWQQKSGAGTAFPPAAGGTWVR